MDYTNFTLDNLYFKLKETQQKLSEIKIDTFTYNPLIAELTSEINDLQEAINKKEQEQED